MKARSDRQMSTIRASVIWYITAFYGANIRKNKRKAAAKHPCGGFFVFLGKCRRIFMKNTIKAEKNQKILPKKSCKIAEKLLLFFMNTGIIYGTRVKSGQMG